MEETRKGEEERMDITLHAEKRKVARGGAFKTTLSDTGGTAGAGTLKGKTERSKALILREGRPQRWVAFLPSFNLVSGWGETRRKEKIGYVCVCM